MKYDVYSIRRKQTLFFLRIIDVFSSSVLQEVKGKGNNPFKVKTGTANIILLLHSGGKNDEFKGSYHSNFDIFLYKLLSYKIIVICSSHSVSKTFKTQTEYSN